MTAAIGGIEEVDDGGMVPGTNGSVTINDGTVLANVDLTGGSVYTVAPGGN